MILDVELGPAAGRRRAALRAAEMQADREAVLQRRLEDRPVAPPAQRLGVLRAKLDLAETPVVGAPLDLPTAGVGIVERDQDRCAQPRFGIGDTPPPANRSWREHSAAASSRLRDLLPPNSGSSTP